MSPSPRRRRKFTESAGNTSRVFCAPAANGQVFRRDHRIRPRNTKPRALLPLRPQPPRAVCRGGRLRRQRSRPPARRAGEPDCHARRAAVSHRRASSSHPAGLSRRRARPLHGGAALGELVGGQVARRHGRRRRRHRDPLDHHAGAVARRRRVQRQAGAQLQRLRRRPDRRQQGPLRGLAHRCRCPMPTPRWARSPTPSTP